VFTLFVVPSIYMLVARKHAPEPVDWDAETSVGEPEEAVA
jgi:hypothetical protein